MTINFVGLSSKHKLLARLDADGKGSRYNALKRNARGYNQNTIPNPWSLRVRGNKARDAVKAKLAYNSVYFYCELLKLPVVAREVPNCQRRSKSLILRYWTVPDCSWAIN